MTNTNIASKITRLGEYNLFVPGMTVPAELDVLLNRLMEIEHPLSAFLGGSETLAVGELVIPIIPRSLSELRIESAVHTVGEPGLTQISQATGVTIQLPGDIVRVVALWEALGKGMEYNLETFWRDYREDAAKFLAGMLEDWVEATKIDGIQAQVDTDIRLKFGEIGFAPKTAGRLKHALLKRYPGTLVRDSVDGWMMLNQRYPVASPNGARMTVVRVLPDRPEGLMFVNAEAWSDKQGGDTDGDAGFEGATETAGGIQTTVVDPIPSLPKIEMYDGTPWVDELVNSWQPIANDAAVKQVMGAKIKELTGSLVYTFQVLARAAGMSAALANEMVGAAEKLADVYRRIYAVMFPCQEAVMDARKRLETVEALYRVANAFGNVVNGGPLDVDALAPFLSASEKATLEKVVRSVGGGVSLARRTAFGSVLAAGQGLEGAVPRILEKMRANGIATERMLTAIQADALGEEFCLFPAAQGEPQPKKEPGEPDFRFDGNAPGIVAKLASLTLGGQKLFPQLKVQDCLKMSDGSHLIRTWIVPVWREGRKDAARVEILLPKFELVGDDGHAQVQLGLMAHRFFRPRFHLAGEGFVKQTLEGFLIEAIIDGLKLLVRRRGKLTSERANDSLNGALKKKIQKLPNSEPCMDLVQSQEFEVVVPPMKETVQRWEHAQKLLTLLADAGFDVLSTSKNYPGSIVMKKLPGYDVPEFLLHVNPFARFLDPKRRPEAREIKKSIPLADPRELSVRWVMSHNPFAGRLTELVAAFFDCNLNVFTRSETVKAPPQDGSVPREDGTRFCFDTGLVTESGMEKMALGYLEIPCNTREDVEEELEALREAFGDAVEVEVVPHDEFKAEGLLVQRFVLRVRGHMIDPGKMKAAVGPFKFVATHYPDVKFSALIDGVWVPIDVVLPRDTAVRKKALDAWLYAACGRVGIKEVDPRHDPAKMVSVLKQKLGGEGLVKIRVEVPGEEPREIGEAFVGPLPFYRPRQVAFRNCKVRTGKNGINVHNHAMVMVGNIPYRQPESVERQFAAAARIVTPQREDAPPSEGGEPTYELQLEYTDSSFEEVVPTVPTSPSDRTAYEQARAAVRAIRQPGWRIDEETMIADLLDTSLDRGHKGGKNETQLVREGKLKFVNVLEVTLGNPNHRRNLKVGRALTPEQIARNN